MKGKVRLRLLQIAWTLLIHVHCGNTQENIKVELHAPHFVHFGSSAVLRCEHTVPLNEIHKVDYLRYGMKIFQYVRERNPPYIAYNMSGAIINPKLATPKSITLEDMQFDSSGSYGCEIVLEHPIMAVPSKEHEIYVIQPQKYPPRIKLSKHRFSALESLEASCSSAPAHPAPHLTWFINKKKVDESLTKPHVSPRRLSSSGLSLHVSSNHLFYPLDRLPLQPNDTLELTCISTIPSHADSYRHYFDVKNSTIYVAVVQMESQPTILPYKQTSSTEQELIPTIPAVMSASNHFQNQTTSMCLCLLLFFIGI